MGSDNLTARVANLSPAKRALLELKLKQKRFDTLSEQTVLRGVPAGSAPLSFAQQRLWFLNQLEPESPAYNESNTFRLSGTLDLNAFKKALNQIVLRHEVLRTVIVNVEGSPCQVVGSNRDVDLPVIDLRAVPKTDRDSEAQRLMVETIRKPFDLSRDLMLRVLLLQLAEQEHIFFVVKHHIASDGWSSGILWKELTALYEAFVSGEPSPLPELPVQYADYAVWQRDWLQGEVLERQLSYWKKQLAGLGALQLPTDRPRPAVQSYRGKRQNLELSKQLSQKLSDLSRQQGATLFMTLLAAFQTLLYRYAGQEDIAVGCPIAGRTRQELEGLIGFFVNTLVMRVNFCGNPTFRELLARVSEVALGAYGHQDLPFEKLVEELQPERSLSYTPLFQVAFAYQNTPDHALEIPGVLVTPLEKTVEATKFDLHLSVKSADERIGATLHYATDLYDDVTIARLLGHFRVLLEGIVEDPDRRLSELPILTEGEKHQLLVEWNDTERDYPKDKCIHELFEEQVERTPDARAVVFPSTGSGQGEDEQLTYRELNQRANQLANYLRKLGVEPDALVGLCVERSLEMIVGLLGILKAGGAYVPLDPEYPKERLAFMLQDTQAPVLLTQGRLIESLPTTSTHIVCLDRDWKEISRESDENLERKTTGENLAYVIYTSGSTGQPKGVPISQRAVNGLVLGTDYVQLTSTDIVAQAANSAFDATTFEIWGALLNGARVIIIPTDIILSPQQLSTQIEKHGITTLFLTTALFNQLVDTTPVALGKLKNLLMGGDAVDAGRVRNLLERAPPKRLLHVYGPTETTTFASSYIVENVDQNAIRIPIGRPISNTLVYVLDPTLNPVPVGVPGELYIGGDGLARGYLNRLELTAEKFIRNPFRAEPGARLYKTGDLGRYLHDGNIEFLGRNDNQVKIRGFRIELGEIESVLNLHPVVRESVVVVWEDEPGDKWLVAYVLAREGQSTSTADLRSFLKSKLPEYMVPSAFVFLDALPLTPNGKVDRRALPAPDRNRAELAKSYEAPRTPTEEILAQFWAEVLRLDKIGIHDNFFEAGGDSILSIQIIARARQAGLQLTPKLLFQHQTIAELAAVASTNLRLRAEQGAVTGTVPLTPIQQWFFEQHFPVPHHWNMAILLEARQVLNPIVLERAVQQLLIHHDALRMRFTRGEWCWQQVIRGTEEEPVFSHLDLSAFPAEQQEVAIESARFELQASLNLAEGPLLRAALFDLGAERPSRLLIAIHHLVVDGVSWRILLEDLQSVYQQLKDGKPIKLPPKTTSFKQWAERISEHARSASIQKELDYWLRVLGREAFRLPVDFPGGSNTETSARAVSVSLSQKETLALLQEVPKAYHTQVNDALLTALMQAFSAWTGESPFLIELEGHGREEIFDDVDLSRTVGWFTSCFPVHLHIGSSAHPGEALKLIKEQLRAIPNRGIGFGLLRYLSKSTVVAEQLRALPQPEVSFNYLGQFDQALSTSGLFAWAHQSAGPTRSRLGNRPHLFGITGRVINGRLQLNWSYSENLHQRATIERLTESFREALRQLINHCLSPGTGGFTPSDFPEAELSQEQLDRVIAELSQAEE